MYRLIILLLLAASLTVVSAAPTTSQSTGGVSERLAYVSFRPGNWDIYYFDKHGVSPRRLTENISLEYDPALSPDGRWVVFCSERRGNPDLYVLDLKHGGEPRLLIASDAMEDQAAISPDGKTIAFVSTHGGNADVFTLPFRPDRTQPVGNAANLTRHPAGDFRPAFSPDSKKIAFTSDRDTPTTGEPAARRREGEVYVMQRDGKSLRRLTTSPGWDGSPAFSADGRTIYFFSTRDKHYRIWAMSAGGDSPRAVSPSGLVALSPALTADGRVAFAARTGAGENARWKIVSVKPDGTDERLESDVSNDYWKPVFDAKTGAMLCHGTGPNESGLPEGSHFPGRTYLGRGPLLASGYPMPARLPDRSLELYPVRGFSIALNSRRDQMLRTELPGPRLVLSDLSGRNMKDITAVQNGELPWIGLSWSRDGEWVAYTAGEMFSPPKAEADVWKMRPDGTEAVNLTPDSPGNDGFPSLSADSSRLVFRSGRTGNFDIFLMQSDGTGLRNLTNHPAVDTFPAFSPLGDEIAFSSNRDGELDPKTGHRTFELYTMKISSDGTPGAVRRLTYTHGQNAHPQYSPDGRWLVFTSEQGGINDEEPIINTVIFSPQIYGELFVCRLEDGKIFRLTNDKWEDGFPNWVSPVG
jgi:Tol biopolymer transport system component